jgi:hypothetical protein
LADEAGGADEEKRFHIHQDRRQWGAKAAAKRAIRDSPRRTISRGLGLLPHAL